MPKFRKKPVVVEAVQFKTGYNLPPGVTMERTPDDFAFSVITIHGQRTSVVIGDWIITEPDGQHYYPCKPDIFEATYEAVEE